jgi:hypothetical protein
MRETTAQQKQPLQADVKMSWAKVKSMHQLWI